MFDFRHIFFLQNQYIMQQKQEEHRRISKELQNTRFDLERISDQLEDKETENEAYKVDIFFQYTKDRTIKKHVVGEIK
jgi:signal transduction protein with GAF and PtsI domain